MGHSLSKVAKKILKRPDKSEQKDLPDKHFFEKPTSDSDHSSDFPQSENPNEDCLSESDDDKYSTPSSEEDSQLDDDDQSYDWEELSQHPMVQKNKPSVVQNDDVEQDNGERHEDVTNKLYKHTGSDKHKPDDNNDNNSNTTEMKNVESYLAVNKEEVRSETTSTSIPYFTTYDPNNVSSSDKEDPLVSHHPGEETNITDEEFEDVSYEIWAPSKVYAKHFMLRSQVRTSSETKRDLYFNGSTFNKVNDHDTFAQTHEVRTTKHPPENKTEKSSIRAQVQSSSDTKQELSCNDNTFNKLKDYATFAQTVEVSTTKHPCKNNTIDAPSNNNKTQKQNRSNNEYTDKFRNAGDSNNIKNVHQPLINNPTEKRRPILKQIQNNVSGTLHYSATDDKHKTTKKEDYKRNYNNTSPSFNETQQHISGDKITDKNQNNYRNIHKNQSISGMLENELSEKEHFDRNNNSNIYETYNDYKRYINKGDIDETFPRYRPLKNGDGFITYGKNVYHPYRHPTYNERGHSFRQRHDLPQQATGYRVYNQHDVRGRWIYDQYSRDYYPQYHSQPQNFDISGDYIPETQHSGYNWPYSPDPHYADEDSNEKMYSRPHPWEQGKYHKDYDTKSWMKYNKPRE